MLSRGSPRSDQHIVLRLRDSAESKFPGRLVRTRSTVAGDPKNFLDRLVETEDIDWWGNTVGRTGDPVFLGQWMRRAANDEDRGGRALPYGQNRVGAGARRTAEIENDDVRLAVTY